MFGGSSFSGLPGFLPCAAESCAIHRMTNVASETHRINIIRLL
jgi:hypothetical protein